MRAGHRSEGFLISVKWVGGQAMIACPIGTLLQNEMSLVDVMLDTFYCVRLYQGSGNVRGGFWVGL